MNALNRFLAVTALMLAGTSAQAVLATFDGLATPPALDSSTGLFFANNGSSIYGGVTWDSRFTVVGDAYRVDPPSGPLFGLPHSGQYFVTNGGTGAGNDGLTINTSMVLTGAWFGRNEYYGFGAGADQITLNAMNGAAVLASVVFDLPELLTGLPEVLSFVDTGAFAALTGITGYRIDRREIGTLAGNWVADDFTFVAASGVPEPSSGWLMAVGLLLLLGIKRGVAAA
ncbi:MAG: PEP-CTERM sorting domain-containing protein [Pseudomonadota bacterium]|nr:PEP-CTERM sorting domain-containing protein [Pseudomonadota bacterium]